MKKGLDGRPRVMPTQYPGSKWTLWEWIRDYMRFPHRGFVDLFGGGGSITISKPAVELRVYNDIDGDAVNFFRQCRDNFEELAWALTMTPYSREEHDSARIKTGDETPLELARKWFVSSWQAVARQSFSGQGWASRISPGEVYQERCVNYVDAKMELYKVAQKFEEIQIEHLDALACISRYQHADTLIYADPPYLRSTGRGVDYNHDMPKDAAADKAFHLSLAEALKAAAGYRIIAGTPTPEYAEWYEECGWQRVDKTAKRDGNGRERGAKYTESMWLCPRVQAALKMTRQMSLPMFDLIDRTGEEEE